jgi:hypothetical protein
MFDTLGLLPQFPEAIVDYYDEVAQVYDEKDFYTRQDIAVIQRYVHLLRLRGMALFSKGVTAIMVWSLRFQSHALCIL